MFNTLLKKASESSFAAMASEAMDSRPGSPAATRRAPGSPLAQPVPGSPARKPRNLRAAGAGTINPHSSNAQLASQLDEAYSDIESFQKLLQKATQEKSEASDADLLRQEKESISEELFEARALIKTMRATLEAKAADEFLSPKATSEEDVMEGSKPAIDTPAKETGVVDPLGAVPDQDHGSVNVSSIKSEEKSSPSSQIYTANGADTAASDRIKELESTLTEKDEQCKELEATLTTRTNELGKQKSDHEEKMKKMKAIFAAANKNLNEYRQSIAAKDEEIAELKARVESQPQQEEASAEQNQAVLDLEDELRNQSELAASRLAQMESKYKQSNAHLEKLRVEYQQYKQRASTLLQQQRESQPTDDDSRLSELQSQLDTLIKENKSVTRELQEVESKKSSVEGELQLAMDQISSLESSQEINRRQERQYARQLKDLERSLKDAQSERESVEARLASLQELRDMEAQSMMRELGGTTKHIEERLAKKEEENTELHRILDRSSDELAAAKQEIQTLRDLVSSSEAQVEAASVAGITSPLMDDPESKSQNQLLITTGFGPRSSFSPHEIDSPISRASSSLSLPAERPPVYSTLSDLLAAKPLVERSPFAETNGVQAPLGLLPAKEKEYQTKLQHLTDLLNESEANHQRLLDQAKVLKEEIRNLDRAERRQNLSVDYLKNIVLKYLETPDKEQLLPVLTTVLQLSPAEVASLKKKSVQPSVPSVLGGLFGGSS
ncbi:GRIP and coiled-coil domain-containing protein 2 [Podila clonocystis]|nr:GRIP and coiled-coil domain-containing protein 2 [Podila clonocystis]